MNERTEQIHHQEVSQHGKEGCAFFEYYIYLGRIEQMFTFQFGGIHKRGRSEDIGKVGLRDRREIKRSPESKNLFPQQLW